MDEGVSMLVSIADCTPEQAQQYLTLADNDVEQATTLWFETGGSLATDSSASAPPVPTSTRPSQPRSRGYAEDADGIVHIDSDDDMDMEESSHPPPNVEDDEAIARRMQEEMYGSGGRSPNQVRAPIERTTETLVGGYGGMGGGGYGEDDVEAIVAQQMAARQARRMAQNQRAGIFSQRETQQNSIWDDPEQHEQGLARVTGGASLQSTRARNLADMFRPPFELMSHLSWEQARDEGKDSAKWLLVNVQDSSIFECQTLNRDLWKDERVSAVIRESFIFLQYSRQDAQDRQSGYVQYYFGNKLDIDDSYPHIAIVDPRTGEQLKIWSGPPAPKVDDFVEALYNFLDRYSLDVAKKNPVAKRKAEQPAHKNVDMMTEEEMLEMAMKNSLGGPSNGAPPKQADPDDLTKSMDFGRVGQVQAESSAAAGGLPTPDVVEEETQTNGETSVFKSIASDRPHEEPARGAPNTTAIQFRYSGGRVVRRFSLDDPVRRMYEWLKASPPVAENAGKDFELKFIGKDLIELLDGTIGEAGLKQASVNVEWTED